MEKHFNLNDEINHSIYGKGHIISINSRIYDNEPSISYTCLFEKGIKDLQSYEIDHYNSISDLLHKLEIDKLKLIIENLKEEIKKLKEK